MEASIRTVVHRLGISKGLVLERPRNITVVDSSAALGPRRNRGNLYILLELLGGLPDPNYVLERLSRVIQGEYYQASGSITGGISQALRTANDWLFEENLNAPREQRGVAGVSCAVLRDGDLYLGQVGPALAYLAQSDGLRRFPEDSPWLRQAIPSDAERAAAPPLGVRRMIEPMLYHATPDVGDSLLLASRSLGHLATSQAIGEALGLGGVAARRQLEVLAAGRDMSALVVSLEAAEVTISRPQARPQAPARDLPAGEHVAPGPARPESNLRPTSVRESSTAAAARPWQRIRRTLSGKGAAAPAVPGEVARGALGWAGLGLRSLLRGTLPGRTGRPRAGRERAKPQGGVRTRLVIALIVLVPLLALSLVAGARYQHERSHRLRIEGLYTEASEARAAAMVSSDPGTQRASLRQAIALLDQLLRLAPEELRAIELREKAVGELDVAAGVQRLYTLWELADLPSAEGGAVAEAGRSVVRGSDVFILDLGTDRAYHRQLSPVGDGLEPLTPGALMVQVGQSRGGITVGELVDIVWMPAGGERRTANLLILERNGSLLEWDPARGIRVLPVADSAAWRRPQATGAFWGNFYLLDPQQNRILRYVPTAGGYTSPPTDYVVERGVDLSGAVDMAIDGHIYVLMADGKILKFLTGKLQPFELTGLDESLKLPVAIYATGEGEGSGFLYVADAGLARVVQLTKQGQFVRQFRTAEGQAALAQLRSVSVDEVRQRMYLSAGSRLYMTPLAGQGGAATPVPSATPGR